MSLFYITNCSKHDSSCNQNVCVYIREMSIELTSKASGNIGHSNDESKDESKEEFKEIPSAPSDSSEEPEEIPEYELRRQRVCSLYFKTNVIYILSNLPYRI